MGIGVREGAKEKKLEYEYKNNQIGENLINWSWNKFKKAMLQSCRNWKRQDKAGMGKKSKIYSQANYVQLIYLRSVITLWVVYRRKTRRKKIIEHNFTIIDQSRKLTMICFQQKMELDNMHN